MSICVSCSSWLAKALKDGLSDVLHGCRTGMQFATKTVGPEIQSLTVYRVHFHHSYRWVLQHKRWCWICCHLWFFSDARFDRARHKVQPAGKQDDDRRMEPSVSDDVLAGHLSVETDRPSVHAAKSNNVGRISNARLMLRCDFGFEIDFRIRSTLELTPEEEMDLSGSLLYHSFAECVGKSKPESSPPSLRQPGAESFLQPSESKAYAPINNDTEAQALLVRSWLDECLSSHKTCRKRGHNSVSSEPRLPTRLIHVGEDDSDVRLFETKGLDASSIEYATLSHMWGKAPFEKLTLSNYNASLTHLSPSALPRTFREAIFFCRRLSIEYVWIDSLCIIQDSPADWDVESVRMNYVYGGSLINLAATESSAPVQGLIRPYQPLLGQEIVLLLPGVAMLRPSIDWNVSHRWFGRYNGDTPLLKRGWVLQECLLAARVLHFTDRGLLFTCNDGQKTDTKVSPRGTQIRFDFKDASTASGADDVDDVWESIMRAYSDTRLTVAGDRVVALAGAAAFVHDVYARLGTQTWYTVGCWDHNMLAQLSWYFPQGVTPQTDLPGLMTPSWSWLSSKGRPIMIAKVKEILKWAEKGVGRSLKLIRAHRRNVDLNAPFATIGITSLLVETFVFDLLDCKFMDIADRSRVAAELLCASDENENEYDDRSGFSSVPIPDISLPRSVGLFLDSQPAGLRTLRCALLAGVFINTPYNLSYLSHALILQDAGEPKNSLRQYRRLGFMNMDRRRMRDATLKFFNRDNLPLQQFWLV